MRESYRQFFFLLGEKKKKKRRGMGCDGRTGGQLYATSAGHRCFRRRRGYRTSGETLLYIYTWCVLPREWSAVGFHNVNTRNTTLKYCTKTTCL